MSSNEIIQVTDEFIKENSKYKKIKHSSKKGGPYSKNDKELRQNEVYRLHFEYGYSARKIADLMKVNRNTINGDVDYWYSKILKNIDIFNPEYAIIMKLEQMKTQKTRLRERLDKVKNDSERIPIERLIYDVDSKVLHTYLKFGESRYRVHKMATEWVNDYMKKNDKSERYLTFFDTISVSDKAHQRIRRIINEDRERRK